MTKPTHKWTTVSGPSDVDSPLEPELMEWLGEGMEDYIERVKNGEINHSRCPNGTAPITGEVKK